MAENRPSVPAIMALLGAGRCGVAQFALVASSASERQMGNAFLTDIAVFEERRNSLGFSELLLLPSQCRLDLPFFDHSLWGSEDGLGREEAIYRRLFPTSPFEWVDYAASKGVEDLDDRTPPAYMRWRNQMLDAQALWAHDHAGQDVFVTSDERLKVINGQLGYSALSARTASEAAWML